MRYFNVKGPHGIETIDEINEADWPSRQAYLKEYRSMLESYRLIYRTIPNHHIYPSSRSTRIWREDRR